MACQRLCRICAHIDLERLGVQISSGCVVSAGPTSPLCALVQRFRGVLESWRGPSHSARSRGKVFELFGGRRGLGLLGYGERTWCEAGACERRKGGRCRKLDARCNCAAFR